MTLDNYYSKWRRMFTIFSLVNFTFSIFQLSFAYQHVVKHEWWMFLVSLFFFCVNFAVGVNMLRQVQNVNNQAKKHVLAILQEKTG